MKQTLRLLFTLLLAIVYGGVCMGQDSETSTNTVTDVLNATNLKLGSSQAVFSGIKVSNSSQAEYAGVANKSSNFIQLKKDSKSICGIYTIKSGGFVKSIKINFNTKSSGSVSIIALNEAFDIPVAINSAQTKEYVTLYSNIKATDTYNITGKYKYVGILAEGSNSARIDEISITWEEESLTTAASGFATYAASYPVNYSNLGLTCYQISLDEANKKVAYTPYTGVVPANKAVLVQGEASKKYTLTKVDADDNNTFSTDLQASDGKTKAANNLYYAFSTKNGVSGFYRVQNDLTIPIGKGYIQLSNASETKFFSFDGGDGTTGIGNIENIEKQIMLDNATIYNLAGQRVSKDYKGVIIVNGKKMVNK